MAALLAEIRGGLNPIFRRVGVLSWRSLSTTTSTGDSSSTFVSPEVAKAKAKVSAPKQEPEPFDNSTYKVEEYFSHREHSFYDIEMEIDGSGRRQQQPKTTVPYKHTEPWKKEAEK